MKKDSDPIYRLVTALLLWALVTAAVAAESGGSRAAELMRLSGIDAQLDRMQKDLVDPESQSLNFRPEDRVRVANIMRVTFAPEPLRASIRQDLARLLTPDVEEAALGWLRSDLGRKVRTLEARVENEGGLTLRHPALAKSILSTAPPERREMYRRLAAAIRYADANADMLFNIFAAVTHAASAASGRQLEHHFIRARAALSHRREEIVRTLNAQAMAALAYTYRDLSDDELLRYIAFAESPAGLRYHDACLRAVSNAFTAAATEMGKRIAEEFSKPR